MDEEWEKQLQDHRTRLEEIAQLVVTHCSKDQNSADRLLEQLRGLVSDSATLEEEAEKSKLAADQVREQLREADELESLNVGEMFREAVPSEVNLSTKYVQQFESLVGRLKQDVASGWDVSQELSSSAVDPWTKLPFTKPVKSRMCGHMYEESSVAAMLKSKKDLRCPYIGCIAKIKATNLYTE